MNRLFLETSTTQASVAFFVGNELISEAAFPSGRGPQTPLFATLQRFLADGIALDEIVVGVGPGSYSGMRIGISAAIGLRLARGIEAFGVYSFLGYAGENFQTILDARGSWVYSAVRENVVCEAPGHISEAELREKIDPKIPIFSPNAIPAHGVLPSFPTASILGRRFLADPIPQKLPISPLYLKAPHITLAKPDFPTLA